jgi:hypothetical protein
MSTAEWFVRNGVQKFGPMSSEQLRRMALEGDVLPDTEVRRSGQDQWHPAKAVKGLVFANISTQAEPPTFSPPASTKTCPFCAEEINANAIKCKHCGEFLNRLEKPEAQLVDEKPKYLNLVQIVDRQKKLIWMLLLSVILEVPVWLLVFFGPPLAGLAAAGFFVAFYVVYRTVISIQLALAIYNDQAMGFIQGLLTCIPILGLLALLSINGRATRTLKRHGIRVGFWGADRIQAELTQNFESTSIG